MNQNGKSTVHGIAHMMVHSRIGIPLALMSILLNSCGADESELALATAPEPTTEEVSAVYRSPVPEPDLAGLSPDDLVHVSDNAVDERITLTDVGGPAADDWWVTTWTGRTVDKPEIYCFGLPNGVSCRVDGERMDHPFQQLLSDRAGTVLLADIGLSSAELRIDGGPIVPLELQDANLPSGRRLAVIPFAGADSTVDISAVMDGVESRVGLVIDLGELRSELALSEARTASAPLSGAPSIQIGLEHLRQAPKELLPDSTTETNESSD